MRVLIIKTSSMGDVIHTLPALSDAALAIPGIKFDWVVEENFAEIPAWHPAVKDVIPVAIRRWRKTPLKSWRGAEWQGFKARLREQSYDCVIDAQGLLKSAYLTRYTKAPRYGLDRHSIREPLASLFYHHRIAVPKNMHAVERIRRLFSEVLAYPQPHGVGNYSLDKNNFDAGDQPHPYMVFLHGTTRFSKYWPQLYWQQLAKKVSAKGFDVLLPWGNEEEKQRAEIIAKSCDRAKVLPKQNLHGLASILAHASAVVAVDTGLGHLSAALDTPAVSLYGSTSPVLIGAYGKQQVHLNAAKISQQATEKEVSEGVEPKEMAKLTPNIVWRELDKIISTAEVN